MLGRCTGPSRSVATAAQFGVTTFDNRKFSALIAQPEGVIVAISTPRVRFTGKLKSFTDNEMKQKAHRLNRRAEARRDTLQSLEGADS